MPPGKGCQQPPPRRDQPRWPRRSRNPFRGPSRWNLDLSLGKQTTIKEGLKVTFLADFFNAFNNVMFANPTLDLNTSNTFGVLTTSSLRLNAITRRAAAGFSSVCESSSDRSSQAIYFVEGRVALMI